MVRIIGPKTVNRVQFYGLLPITDFVAASVTAPNLVDYVDGAGGDVIGTLTNVKMVAGQLFPATVTGIVVPAGGEVWGLKAVPQ